MTALAIQGLCKGFSGHLSIGRTEVLRGVDLTVEAGETYGFIGANGAGKTTTIKIVASLIRADAGTVRLFGQDSRTPASRRSLGFLPESPSFYGSLTGREFLAFHARLAGVEDAAREVEQRLEETGMLSRADRPLRKCSKGMQQRIGIAQALLGNPRILVLDEPMSGLDPLGRRDVRNIMLAARERGTTIFFSSHILSDAEALCDRVGFLQAGRIAREGRLETLLEEGTPAWEITARCPGEPPELPGAAGIRHRNGHLFARVEGEAHLKETLERLLAADASITGVTPYRHSLEERYVAVVEATT